MERFFYSGEMLLFLEEGYKVMRIPELTEAFNQQFVLSKTCGQVKACLKNHKFRSGRVSGLEKGERSKYSAKQRQFITEHFRGMAIDALTVAFNVAFGTDVTVSQIRAFIKNNGIKSGRTGYFESGHKPWNAGTSGQGLTGANSGSFKEGNTPINLRSLWSERICSKDGYILIKVPERNPYTGAPTRFKAKHVWLWEQEYGRVPKGHILMFKDGDKLNCVLENLEYITRAEAVRLNKLRYSTAPEELKPTLRILAKVQARKGELSRQHEDVDNG